MVIESTAAPSPRPRFDVAVVGAGPAGMAAAVTAADAGCDVCVLDLNERPGGQYWRWGPCTQDGRFHHDWAVFLAWRARFDDHVATGRITYYPGHGVFGLVEGRPWSVLAVSGERTRELVTLHAERVVVATGAYDRQFPFPGWTLPGVMAPGATQALLKGSSTLAGARVVVAGTGPLLLPVAAGLVRAGATVVAVAEANDPLSYLRHPAKLASSWRKSFEALDYLSVLARHRVPLLRRRAVVAAHGDDRLEAVTVARVDRSWRVVAGSQRRIEADVVACGYGFVPQVELLDAAGAELRPAAAPVAVVDPHQETSVAGLYAAGETTGVGGAELAVFEGAAAGAATAASVRGLPLPPTGGRGAERLRGFAALLDEVHAVAPGWTGWLEPATVVCRCEEVSVADLWHALSLGADDVRSVKLLARPGMGWCQGRMCGHVVAGLLGQPSPPPRRPLAQPVPLGALAGLAGAANEGHGAGGDEEVSRPVGCHTV